MMPSLIHIFSSEALEQISKGKGSQGTGHFHYIVHHLSNLWSHLEMHFFEHKIHFF